jgi:hypothetical protein
VEYGEPPCFTDEQVAHKRQRAAELEPLVGYHHLDEPLAADDHADAAHASDTLAMREPQWVGMPTAELARTLAAREVWSKLELLALILVEDARISQPQFGGLPRPTTNWTGTVQSRGPKRAATPSTCRRSRAAPPRGRWTDVAPRTGKSRVCAAPGRAA